VGHLQVIQTRCQSLRAIQILLSRSPYLLCQKGLRPCQSFGAGLAVARTGLFCPPAVSWVTLSGQPLVAPESTPGRWLRVAALDNVVGEQVGLRSSCRMARERSPAEDSAKIRLWEVDRPPELTCCADLEDAQAALMKRTSRSPVAGCVRLTGSGEVP